MVALPTHGRFIAAPAPATRGAACPRGLAALAHAWASSNGQRFSAESSGDAGGNTDLGRSVPPCYDLPHCD